MSVVQDLGKVSVTVAGVWSGANPYTRLDIVSYEGNSYIAVKDVPSGISLTDTTYWLCIAEKGGKGDKGDTGDTGATGNGIASVEKTGTSGNVDTYTITYTDGSITTFTVTNGAVTSVDGKTGDVTLSNKAEIDGSYEDLTAGSAEQLLSSVYVEDNTPYSFRTSGGNLEIGNREEQRKIIGVSVVQNQLINPNSSQSSGTTDGVTVTNNKDGSYTLTGTKTTNVNTYYYLMYSLPVGSKYVICGANTANAGGGGASGGYNLFCAYLNAGTSFAKQQGSQPLIINPSDTTKEGWRLQLQIGYANGAIHTYNDTIRPMVINLTQRFGAEFADWLYSLTRAKYTEILYQLIPELNGGFIPFDTGVLGSVNVSKHIMTGFNQYNPNTDVVRVIRGNQYQITGSYTSLTGEDGSTITPDANGYFTPEKTQAVSVADGNSADTCVHLVWDGERDGEFEEYKTHEYDYDSSVELRGLLRVDSNGNIYADGDEYKTDGSVKRKWGIANLGTAITSWDYQQRGGYGRFGAIQKLAGASTSGGTDINILCGKYAPNASLVSANAVNKAICLYNGSVYIRDDNYTTSAQLVTALQNVWIIYPLATITEETVNPYTETQVVDNWGTEEFVDAQERDFVIPVGHVTDYPQDLKAKLETAPNAPSENGDYLVRQSNSGTEYVPYTDGARIDNLEETKADKNGYYEEMAVGNAEQLLSNNYLEDKTAYNFRRTADGKAVGDREIDEIIGGTLTINQIFKTMSTVTARGVTYTKVNDSTFSLNGTVVDSTWYYQHSSTPKAVVGHVYYVDKGSNAPFEIYNDAGGVATGTSARYTVGKATVDNYFFVRMPLGETYDNVEATPMIIDLTQMFGSSTIADYIYNLQVTESGAGVAWLFEYFPILNGGHIPHNTGTLQSIVLSKHKLTGFNQWDEEWEVGAYNTSTGQKQNSTTQIRSVNKIRILPNTSYSVVIPHSSYISAFAVACYYDINDNFISTGNIRSINDTIVSPNNAYYMTFFVSSLYGNTYKNNICISFDSDRNGEYEPYTIREYDLDSSKELRGIAKIDSNGKLYFYGDRYKDSVARIFAVVNMGDMDWYSYDGESYNICFYATPPSPRVAWEGLSDEFVRTDVSYVSLKDREFTNQSGARTAIFVRDDRYTTVESFKTAMRGKYLLYELATPVTESATPIPNPQICSPYGTEEYIDPRVEAGTNLFAIPTGHNTKYLQNLRQKLDDLPFAPIENGDYLVRVSSDGIAFIPFANGTQIPTIPTSDGTYDLVANVSSGTVTLSWVLRS